MAITPSQWSHVLTIPESYTPSAATSGQTLVITESVITKLSAGDQSTFWSNVANGGGDVRICTDSGGVNQLPVEVVSLDNTAQTCVIWTRKPTYSGTGNLYLFVGKAGETQPFVTDPFGRNAVWVDSSFNLNFISGVSDSSGNYQIDELGSPVYSVGPLGGVANLTNAGFYISSVSENFTQGYNVSFYATIQDFGYWGALIRQDDNLNLQRVDTSSDFVVRHSRESTTGINKLNQAFNIGVRSLYSISWNPATGDVEFFRDGVLRATINNTKVPSFSNASLTLFYQTSSVNVDATAETYRLDRVHRNQEYISTEYANQNDPATFYGTPTLATTGGVVEQPVISVTDLSLSLRQSVLSNTAINTALRAYKENVTALSAALRQSAVNNTQLSASLREQVVNTTSLLNTVLSGVTGVTSLNFALRSQTQNSITIETSLRELVSSNTELSSALRAGVTSTHEINAALRQGVQGVTPFTFNLIGGVIGLTSLDTQLRESVDSTTNFTFQLFGEIDWDAPAKRVLLTISTNPANFTISTQKPEL